MRKHKIYLIKDERFNWVYQEFTKVKFIKKDQSPIGIMKVKLFDQSIKKYTWQEVYFKLEPKGYRIINKPGTNKGKDIQR